MSKTRYGAPGRAPTCRSRAVRLVVVRRCSDQVQVVRRAIRDTSRCMGSGWSSCPPMDYGFAESVETLQRGERRDCGSMGDEMSPAVKGFFDCWSVAGRNPPQRRRRRVHSEEPTRSSADVAAVRTAVHECMQVVVGAPGRQVDDGEHLVSRGCRDGAIVVVGFVAPHEAGAAFCCPVDVFESGNELGHSRRVERGSHLGHVDLCEFRSAAWINPNVCGRRTFAHSSAQFMAAARATGFPSGSRTYPTRSPQAMSSASRSTSMPASVRLAMVVSTSST